MDGTAAPGFGGARSGLAGVALVASDARSGQNGKAGEVWPVPVWFGWHGLARQAWSGSA